MGRYFAIGDVHGCYKTLKKLLFEELKITKDDRLIFLGDYIDRGPDSKKVLKLIMNLIDNEYEIETLLGNHELMLLESINSPFEYYNWLKFGGKETLKSFKVLHPNEIKQKYIAFFKNLSYFKIFKNNILVHGGLNFKIDNPMEDLDSMPWIRNSEVDSTRIGGRKIIVGHTPYTINEIHKSLLTNRILLDGGCVYKDRKGLGNLVALELHSMKIFNVYNID
jgi:serine/threonine protein phosphatase 1